MSRDPLKLHEILHAAHLIYEMFEVHINEREDVQQDPEICDNAVMVSQALWDFYQLVGALETAKEGEPT